MATQKNIGVYHSDDPALEGEWGNTLIVSGIETAISRGVGGGIYHLYLGGEVEIGDSLVISRKRGENPQFNEFKNDDLHLIGDTITALQTKKLLTSITIFMLEE